MSSRDKTHKAVSALVEAMHDNRFSPFLFASSLSVESDNVNWLFFEVINEYINLMGDKSVRGTLSGTAQQIGLLCEEMRA